MSAFIGDRDFDHAQPEGTLVLLVNLGSPDAPQTPEVRRYLDEFLSDPRVIELPSLLRWLLLHGIVLRFRPRRSAAAYREVWTEAGSPLVDTGRQQASALQAALHESGWDVPVRIAMRYGNPSIADVLAAYRGQGLKRLLVVPLYPQYSGSTTGSVFDAVADELKRWRRVPELRMLTEYHDQPHYIAALAAQVREAGIDFDDPGTHLMMSFHGLPERYLFSGDPYFCHCQATARLLREALGLAPERISVTFQSRVGREKWLTPYTDDTLKALPARGVRRLYVTCPGFAADCLETIEEIAMTGEEQFMQAGGEAFHYIGALNVRPDHIAALKALVDARSADWRADAADASGLSARAGRAEAARSRLRGA